MRGSGKSVDLLGELEGWGGLLRKYQSSRWFKNNSLIVKAFIQILYMWLIYVIICIEYHIVRKLIE